MTGARRVLAYQGHYAGALSRLLAYGLDLTIISVIYGAALALVEFAINIATPWEVNLKDGYLFVTAGLLIWSACYLGVSWVVAGRSPGMTVLGLQIVRADGAHLDRRHALIRLCAFPLGFLTLGLGFLGIIFGRTHQALYDRIADTAVVFHWDAEAAKLRDLATRGERVRHAQALEQSPTE